MKYFSEDKKVFLKGHKKVNKVKKAEVFIVKGGDGSILRAVKYLVTKNLLNVKIFGINTGHLGFLSNDISIKKAAKVLNTRKLKKLVRKKDLLKVTSGLHDVYGINELAIQSSIPGKLLVVQLNINGNQVVYKGDGLLITTSAGSTAYNLSAGGPIIDPRVKALCITPLNPFSLASRPLVLPPDSVITISDSTPNISLCMDGMPTGFENGKICLSKKNISLIKITSFMSDIENKLGWNFNIKN